MAPLRAEVLKHGACGETGRGHQLERCRSVNFNGVGLSSHQEKACGQKREARDKSCELRDETDAVRMEHGKRRARNAQFSGCKTCESNQRRAWWAPRPRPISCHRRPQYVFDPIKKPTSSGGPSNSVQQNRSSWHRHSNITGTSKLCLQCQTPGRKTGTSMKYLRSPNLSTKLRHSRETKFACDVITARLIQRRILQNTNVANASQDGFQPVVIVQVSSG